MDEDLEICRKILEDALAKAESAGPNDAPFGMNPECGGAYNSGKAAAYHHALEMLPSKQTA